MTPTDTWREVRRELGWEQEPGEPACIAGPPAWRDKVLAEGKRQGTAESRTSSDNAAAGGSSPCRAGRGAAFGRGAPGVFPERSEPQNPQGVES